MNHEADSVLKMVSLLGDQGQGGSAFMAREGTTLTWFGGEAPDTVVGSMQILGIIEQGLHVDPSIFSLGRTPHFFCDRRVSGKVTLESKPRAYRRSLLDLKIRGDVEGNFHFIEGAVAHGSLEVTVARRVGCSITIETAGETGWTSAQVEIRGDEQYDVSVQGLPFRVTKLDDGTLYIRVDSSLNEELQRSISESMTENRLNREIARQLDEWERSQRPLP